ncbi:unnamed protein product [Cuscuta europaea]|uniref:Uncharacterized protein n=1 Tax=Cuscuta europaea TaxID=41803 RepID=A0A9P1ENC4_CUSEU|nr:unnamed protein product [Cuscuta europaea]
MSVKCDALIRRGEQIRKFLIGDAAPVHVIQRCTINFGMKSIYHEMLSRKINLKSILTPSTTGDIVGFIVGLTNEIRKLLIGDASPLHVIHRCTINFGMRSMQKLKKETHQL